MADDVPMHTKEVREALMAEAEAQGVHLSHAKANKMAAKPLHGQNVDMAHLPHAGQARARLRTGRDDHLEMGTPPSRRRKPEEHEGEYVNTIAQPTPTSKLAKFEFNSLPVRIVQIDGEPAFITADLLAILELGRSSVALLDNDEKGVHSMDTPGGLQQLSYVTEPGMYSLILRSRKPEAKAFKRWVTHEVLPMIRKTGSYSTALALPQSYADALRELAASVEAKEQAEAARIAAEQARELAEAKTKELQPPADAWNSLASPMNGNDYSARDAAHVLNRDGINIGQNRLFSFMETLGWIHHKGNGKKARWWAYQTAVDAGYVVEKLPQTIVTNHWSGTVIPPTPQIRVTPKGIEYLKRKLRPEETEDGQGVLLPA